MKYSTKKYFGLFQEKVKYWLNYYGLKGLEAHIRHEKLDGIEADMAIDRESKLAIIRLATQWPYKVTDEAIDIAGFHESTEALLWPLQELARDRFNVTEKELDEARHNIIAILQNTFYKDHKDKLKMEAQIADLKAEIERLKT